VKGLLLGLISTCIWGGFYPISRSLLGDTESNLEIWNFTFLRFLLAALFLTPVFFKRQARQQAEQMIREDWKLLLVCGLIGSLGEATLVFWAGKYSTAARVSLMANTSPISTMIISWFAGVELLSKNKVAGMLIGLLGVVLMVLGQGGDIYSQGTSTILGDMMAFSSGICWSIYTVYGAKMSKKYGSLVCCGLAFWLSAVALLPVALLKNGGIEIALPLKDWLGIIYLGGLSYGLADAIWVKACQYATPGQIGSLGYVSASIAILLSIIFLHEQITVLFVAAILCVLCGVGLMMKSESEIKG